ncbi:hypothetical protein ACO2Q7_09330 [Rathayibacter sp. KR2-224]|uniref:hypothetical protein n=1 Tax=Rathayibacter sp. KR2-224 TaxID=3400913 RepID=UPI003C092A13
MYLDFLPRALASGAYRAAPDPIVVGQGLAHISDALDRLGKGVSAGKFVVTI